MSLFSNEQQGENMNTVLGSSVAQLAREYEQATGQPASYMPAQGSLTHNTAEIKQENDELRPQSFDDFQGQERIKNKLKKYLKAAMVNNQALMHALLVAKAGQGKTTLASIVANELGVDVYWEGCPIHRERLLELSQEMQDGDILMLDEVHLQAKTRTAGASPEVLYHIMEQFKVITINQGIIDFPRITVIGATTDEGMLPTSFKERFPLKITFDEYTDDDLLKIAMLNADQLGVNIDDDAASMFAGASLSIPREVNNLMKQAGSLARALGESIDAALAQEVLEDDGRQPDGLTKPMMQYLEGLWGRRRYSKAKEEWIVKASLSTMAHIVDRARDKQTVEHDIEPILIKRGYVDIAPGGRTLTRKGMDRINVKFERPPVA